MKDTKPITKPNINQSGNVDINLKALPIIPPNVGGATGGTIGSFIPGIGNFIGTVIGTIVVAAYDVFAWLLNQYVRLQELSFIFQSLVCALEWWGWLSLINSLGETLQDMGFEDRDILELLGLNGLFTAKNIKKQIGDSLATLKPAMLQAKEVDRRVNMSPSGLNGTHRPGYHSIAISEIHYQFSNILGSGVMIIIFNPEGFGNKPRAPEIIRYVDESELSEFLDAKSWGNHWRLNYLLKRRKRKSRTQPIEEIDEKTGGYFPQPESEPLDDYIERALDLPDFADDIIQDEFGEMILQAFDRQEFLTKEFTKAIEKGNLGRGVEEKGLRVTSAIQDKWQEVPQNVRRWTATNPIFKDVVSVTGAWKKQLARIRNVRDKFASAATWGSLKSEALAVSGGLGQVGRLQFAVGAATDFGIQLGTGLIPESVKAGYSTSTGIYKGYAQAKVNIDVSIKTTFFNEGASLDSIYSKISDSTLLSNSEKRRLFEILDEARVDYISSGNSVDLSKFVNELRKMGLEGESIYKIIFGSIYQGGKGILAGIVLPPACIPFTTIGWDFGFGAAGVFPI